MTICVNYDYKIMISRQNIIPSLLLSNMNFFSSRIYTLILIIHRCWRIPILTTPNDEYFKTISWSTFKITILITNPLHAWIMKKDILFITIHIDNISIIFTVTSILSNVSYAINFNPRLFDTFVMISTWNYEVERN